RNDLTDFERRARAARGFVPLVERAIKFALDGITSAEEVMRTMSGVEADDGRDLLDDVLGSASAERASDGDAPAAAAAAGSLS
ncbi:MAG TPA: hypothetical protein VFJ95_06465, partial [Gammaproteobacteria bacterium]|nr:hypothetical protein [Gammaproteobacteria bacterium]